MDTNDAGAVASDEPSNRKISIITCVMIIGLFFVLNDLVGWIERGGLFSIISAINSAHAKARAIDVDSAGMRTAFITASCIAITALSVRLDLNPREKLTSFVLMI